MMRRLLLLFLLAGCGSDPVAYSEPISLKLGGVKEGDIKNGAYSLDKNVNTESGNPYATFLSNARSALDGSDPSAIEVDRLVLTVASDAKGIGTDGFFEVFGTLEAFLADDDKTTVVIGTVDPVPKGTTLDVPISATRDNLAVLRPDLLKGSIKVGIRGNAASSRPNDFDLKTNAQVTFHAYE